MTGIHRKRKNRMILLLAVFLFFSGKEVKAAQEESVYPHLIQTVSDRDISEGLAVLGFAATELTGSEEPEQVYEAVKESVVRLDMGKAYGSGVVWRFTPGYAVIVTNAHVLEFWDDRTGVVCFAQGFQKRAQLAGISAHSDVGFLKIELDSFEDEQLMQLRQVNTGQEAGLPQTRAGERIMQIGAGADETEWICTQGTLEDLAFYIPDLGAEMLYCAAQAKEGMSGGGTFDRYGRYIGMLTGGTDYRETASIPAQVVAEAYEEVCAEY